MTGSRHRILAGALLGAAIGVASGAAIARAAFTSPATASQAISSRNLVAPASLTATPSGHDVNLSWPTGSNGSGYAVATVNNGTSSNCTSATFSALASTASTTYADTGRYLQQGTYQCYRVATTYGTWSSVSSNPLAAAQLGFVASTIQVTNGGVAGTLDPGDTIVITYNQPVTTTTGPIAANKVCTNAASSGAIVMIGSAITSCTASTPVTVGSLSGGTSGRTATFAATWTWSAGNTVLTVTVGARSNGVNNPAVSGTLTFAPTTTAASMLSATGSFHNCDTNTGGGNCLPTVTGSF